MSEFFKVPPFLINSAKPEKADFPHGQELLNKRFFEKLRQDLLPGGEEYFKKLIITTPNNLPFAITEILPYIKSQELKNAISSQLLTHRKSNVRNHASSYLAGNSDEFRHHRLVSQTPRKYMNPKVTAGQIPAIRLQKTGSELYVLLGEYKGKEIVRKISKESYSCWHKALTSEKAWKEAGFDYVPVEPIVKNEQGDLQAFPQQDGAVTVRAKVLGPNLFSFATNKKNRKYLQKLVDQANKIEQVLEKDLHIEHGHSHQYNYCVEGTPAGLRVYLIDWDRAQEISEK